MPNDEQNYSRWEYLDGHVELKHPRIVGHAINRGRISIRITDMKHLHVGKLLELIDEARQKEAEIYDVLVTAMHDVPDPVDAENQLDQQRVSILKSFDQEAYEKDRDAELSGGDAVDHGIF